MDTGRLIFTSHLAAHGTVLPRPTGTWKGEHVIRLSLDALTELRSAYRFVAAEALQHDFVLTFACGGFPPFLYAARQEALHRWGSRHARNASQHTTLQAKYHLLPGLAWSNGSGAAQLHHLLGSLRPDSNVLIADCSFTGGAIAAAANALQELAVSTSAPRVHVKLVGLVDRGRLDEAKVANLPESVSGPMTIQVELRRVADLAFEDFPELIGYEALQSQIAVEPQWSPGAVIVSDFEAGRSAVRAGIPMYESLNDLLEDDDWPTAGDLSVLDADLDATTASTLYFVLRHRFERDLSNLREKGARQDASTNLKLRSKLLGEWKKEILRLNQCFGQDYDMPCSIKALEQEVRSERALLRGDTASYIDLQEPQGSEVPVSLRLKYMDHHENLQTEFTMLVPVVALADAVVQDDALEALVPGIYKKHFDRLIRQLNAEEVESLQQSWNAIKADLRGALMSKG